MGTVLDQTSQITRVQARTRGLATYYTGKPCKHGHVARQWVRNGECVECSRARSRRNVKRWSEEFAERDPEGSRAYHAKRAREGYARNPEPRKTAAKRYAQANPDKVAERLKRWREANHERLIQYDNAFKAQWRRDNPEAARLKGRLARQRRRARELGADGTFTFEDIERLLIEQSGICAGGCGADITERYEIDHKVSLFNGGTNWPANLQLMCRSCNARKHVK